MIASLQSRFSGNCIRGGSDLKRSIHSMEFPHNQPGEQ
jgi:hypothetical protein